MHTFIEQPREYCIGLYLPARLHFARWQIYLDTGQLRVFGLHRFDYSCSVGGALVIPDCMTLESGEYRHVSALQYASYALLTYQGLRNYGFALLDCARFRNLQYKSLDRPSRSRLSYVYVLLAIYPIMDG